MRPRTIVNTALLLSVLHGLTSCGSPGPIAEKPKSEPPATRVAVPTAQPGLKAVYDISKVGEKAAQGSMTLRLVPGALAVRSGDVETVYDFSARRTFWIDHTRREMREASLYANPGFRALELENRKLMTRISEALGRQEDMVDAETELGITQAQPAKVRLVEQHRGDARVFAVNGREAATFVGLEKALAPELVPTLERLFVYQARLHPSVRNALLREPRLPKRFEFSWQTMQTRTTVTWELREVVEEPFDVAAAINQYPLQPLESQGILDLAEQVRGGKAGVVPSSDTYRRRAADLLAAGRGFEAFLAVLEMSFATGATDTSLLQRARQQAAADPRMQAVLRALELEKRSPKDALAQLDSVDAQGIERAYVLDILRANQYLRLGRMGDARAAFGRALASSPLLVGPWIDVGQLYYGSYQMEAAWTCWDAARAIAPGSPLLRGVDELEAALRKNYPFFF